MKKFNLVYLVDDDEIFRAIEKIYIKAHPAFDQFQEFENGKLALDSIKSNIEKGEELPELILLDLNMPVLDGWQFLEECVRIPQMKDIPIVIVSSSIDPGDFESAKNYKNVKDFLKKPVNIGSFDQLLALATDR